MLNNIKSASFTIILLGAALAGSAQRDTVLNREVEVVKSFKPKILDSYKINEMPKIEETEIQKGSQFSSISTSPSLRYLPFLLFRNLSN